MRRHSGANRHRMAARVPMPEKVNTGRRPGFSGPLARWPPAGFGGAWFRRRQAPLCAGVDCSKHGRCLVPTAPRDVAHYAV